MIRSKIPTAFLICFLFLFSNCQSKEKNIDRQPSVAGQFYPEKKADLDDWTAHEKPGNETGIDVVLEKEGNKILIEAKGARASQKNARSSVASALGQIIKDMNDNNPEGTHGYCVAFPSTGDFRKASESIPLRCRRLLGVNVIFVDCVTGLLTVRQPNSRDEVALASFSMLLQ